MPTNYATPAQYISEYGLTEAVQMLADEEQLLTADLLKAAMSGTWLGTETADEQAAATAALARLTRKLESSSSLMDGYIRAVATLPLPTDNASAGMLTDCCLALTRCALADDTDNATERMDDTGKQWRQWLRDVSMGKVQLVGLSGTTAPARNKVFSGPVKSGFGWGGFGSGDGGGQ